MVYPCARFHCDRSTNNEDAGGWLPHQKMSRTPSPIRVNWVNSVLTNSSFQLMLEVSISGFSFSLGISNEITKFPMNLLNSNLEISTSLKGVGHKKR